MKPVLWMKSSCSSCRAARAALAELGIEVEVRDYFKIPLNQGELERLLPADPASMLGTRSPKYRELGLGARRLTKQEAIELMLQDNNLLKRPILVHVEGTVIGFDPEAYGKLRR